MILKDISLIFQNVLEIQVYDEDPLNRDDRCAYILFDIRNLVLGQQETKALKMDEKVNL